MSGNKQLTNKVVSKEYKKSVSEFEKSHDNIVKSIATYYASGVMGKRKYKSVRKGYVYTNVGRVAPIF